MIKQNVLIIWLNTGSYQIENNELMKFNQSIFLKTNTGIRKAGIQTRPFHRAFPLFHY
jgi:hypothetical protein